MRPVPDEIVTKAELAQIMRCSVRTIERMQADGMPSVSWGRRMRRFRVADALRWAEDQ